MKSGSKKIQIFTSFEEEKSYEAKKQVSLTYNERLTQLECLRKIIYKEHLLPDGSWKPLVKKITIVTNKMSTGRLKDLADVEELQRIHLFQKDYPLLKRFKALFRKK